MNAYNPRLAPYDVTYKFYQNGLLIYTQHYREMKPVYEGHNASETSTIKDVDFDRFSKLLNAYDYKETKRGRTCKIPIYGAEKLRENDHFAIEEVEKPIEDLTLKDLLAFPADQAIRYIKENLPILEEPECQKE